MNYLLLLPGWFLGWAIVNTLIKTDESSNFGFLVKITLWTLAWIWIFWRFIR